MSLKWYFLVDDDTILLRARAEGEDGRIGDAVRVVRPGQKFYGVSYDELAKCDSTGGGTLTIADDGSYTVTAAPPLPPDPPPPTDEERAAIEASIGVEEI